MPADTASAGQSGSGAGALPMALREAFPEIAVDAVEPDREVADVAARFFGMPRGDARLRHHPTDGAAFLSDCQHAGQVLACSIPCRSCFA